MHSPEHRRMETMGKKKNKGKIRVRNKNHMGIKAIFSSELKDRKPTCLEVL